jgi:hypothetical protein
MSVTSTPAIDSKSTNGRRLLIAPDGQRLKNEEDGTLSVIDLPRHFHAALLLDRRRFCSRHTV